MNITGYIEMLCTVHVTTESILHTLPLQAEKLKKKFFYSTR